MFMDWKARQISMYCPDRPESSLCGIDLSSSRYPAPSLRSAFGSGPCHAPSLPSVPCGRPVERTARCASRGLGQEEKTAPEMREEKPCQ